MVSKVVRFKSPIEDLPYERWLDDKRHRARIRERSAWYTPLVISQISSIVALMTLQLASQMDSLPVYCFPLLISCSSWPSFGV